MSKKVKAFILMITVIVALTATLGTIHVLQMINKNTEKYEHLVEDLEKDRKDAEAEVTAAKKELKTVQKKYDKTFDKLTEVKEELKKLKNDTTAYSTSVETSDPTPVATEIPQETLGVTQPGNEFSDGTCYRDHEGVFTYYGMEMIIHSNRDGTYDIIIQDTVPGAHGMNCTSATGRWENDVLTYTNGSRSHSDGGVYELVATDCTGTIRHDDGGGMVWSDSMGGTDIGPFTRKS